MSQSVRQLVTWKPKKKKKALITKSCVNIMQYYKHNPTNDHACTGTCLNIISQKLWSTEHRCWTYPFRILWSSLDEEQGKENEMLSEDLCSTQASICNLFSPVMQNWLWKQEHQFSQLHAGSMWTVTHMSSFTCRPFPPCNLLRPDVGSYSCIHLSVYSND